MVEMRWIKRLIPDQPTQAKERVLQYRVLRDVTPVTTETHVAPFPFTVNKEWTEWMDVPDVSAEL